MINGICIEKASVVLLNFLLSDVSGSPLIATLIFHNIQIDESDIVITMAVAPSTWPYQGSRVQPRCSAAKPSLCVRDTVAKTNSCCQPRICAEWVCLHVGRETNILCWANCCKRQLQAKLRDVANMYGGETNYNLEALVLDPLLQWPNPEAKHEDIGMNFFLGECIWNNTSNPALHEITSIPCHI